MACATHLEKYGLGGEDSALLTEGVDDRDRLVMGTFTSKETTQSVREALMAHVEDFNRLLERAGEGETRVKNVDDVERLVCPQSVLLLSEMFDHLFDYAQPELFVQALKGGLIRHLLDALKVFSFNTYLHCHVFGILRRQIERQDMQLTKQIFDETELLQMTKEGVVMVMTVDWIERRNDCPCVASTTTWWFSCETWLRRTSPSDLFSRATRSGRTLKRASRSTIWRRCCLTWAARRTPQFQ